jgi:hypothetical protein
MKNLSEDFQNKDIRAGCFLMALGLRVGEKLNC